MDRRQGQPTEQPSRPNASLGGREQPVGGARLGVRAPRRRARPRGDQLERGPHHGAEGHRVRDAGDARQAQRHERGGRAGGRAAGRLAAPHPLHQLQDGRAGGGVERPARAHGVFESCVQRAAAAGGASLCYLYLRN